MLVLINLWIMAEIFDLCYTVAILLKIFVKMFFILFSLKVVC